MFNFMSMMFNYEERKVDHSEIDGNTVIDTCLVTDGAHPFETGIHCPKYNHGEWVIVEAYDTKEDAQKGHNKWVGIMRAEKQPERLIECPNSKISQIIEAIGGEDEMTFEEEF